MQNWNTKKSIPKNIGNCLNLPVIINIQKADKIYSKTHVSEKNENSEINDDIKEANSFEALKKIFIKKKKKKKTYLKKQND